MPEYLAPGVYLEEVSFRAKSIEGVSTTTTAYIGPTRFGTTEGEPELITSYNQFERIYGGLDQLAFYAADDPAYSATNPATAMHNYLAQAVREFFDNGGRRLYVSRAYRSFAAVNDARASQGQPPLALPAGLNADGIATASIPTPSEAIVAANDAAAAAVASANRVLDEVARVATAAAARTAGSQRLRRLYSRSRTNCPHRMQASTPSTSTRRARPTR